MSIIDILLQNELVKGLTVKALLRQSNNQSVTIRTEQGLEIEIWLNLVISNHKDIEKSDLEIEIRDSEGRLLWES